ncbi:hypothetical protein ACFLYR_08900, partial [Chloroflexota bacterium]
MNKYVVSNDEYTTIGISKSDLSAVKAYARTHKKTGTTALHLAIAEGLLSLLAKEEKAEVDRDLRILQLGQEFLKKEKRKSKQYPRANKQGRGTTKT